MSLDMEQPSSGTDSAPGAEPESHQPDLESSSDGLLEQQQTDPDEVEDELDGVKLRGKKELLERIKSERLMQADYTRKTQEVAEQRKAYEAQQAQFQQERQWHQQNLREVAALHHIDDRLGQFQQLNWQQLNAEDPQRAQALLIEFQQLQSQRGQLQNSLTQRQQQQAWTAQQETAKRIQEGQAILARDIKGWGPDLAQKLTEFGVSVGIPKEALANATDPLFVKVLYKAYIGEQLEKKATAKPPAEPQKPVTRVNGAAASNQKPLGDVTDPREWAERRRQWKNRNR